jgi:hypothetical protein
MGQDPNEKIVPVTYCDVTDSAFCIKDFEKAIGQLVVLRSALYKDATTFFSRFLAQKPPSFIKKCFSNFEELISTIFEASKGLSIADIHNSTATRYFLATYMKCLVKYGVDTIFSEFFFSAMQRDLDAYFDPKTNVESVPFSLQKISQAHRETREFIEKNAYTGLDLLKIAKKSGIKRMVALDDLTCNDCEMLKVDDESTVQRVCTFNYFAKNIIEKEMPRNMSFLAAWLMQ